MTTERLIKLRTLANEVIRTREEAHPEPNPLHFLHQIIEVAVNKRNLYAVDYLSELPDEIDRLKTP